MREVAEDTVAGRVAAEEGGRLVVAVDLLVGLACGAAGAQQRRVEVDRLHQEVGGGAGLHLAGPDDDAGLAGAALVERGLAAAVGQVARRGDLGEARGVGLLGRVGVAAVVGPEHDDRVVRLARVVEMLQQPAHRIIEALHHRGVQRVLLRVRGVGLLLEVLDVVLAGVPRGMHGEQPEVQEERAALAGADELAGLVGHALIDVATGVVLDRGIGDELPGGEVAAAGAGRLGRVRPVQVEALVARFVGVARFQVMAEVPLAEVRRRVTRGLERLGEGMVIGLEAGDAIGDEYADFTVLVLAEAFRELHRR